MTSKTKIDTCDDCGGQLDQTDSCSACGIYHGDPCPDCGRRGIHLDTCRTVTDPDMAE